MLWKWASPSMSTQSGAWVLLELLERPCQWNVKKTFLTISSGNTESQRIGVNDKLLAGFIAHRGVFIAPYKDVRVHSLTLNIT